MCFDVPEKMKNTIKSSILLLLFSFLFVLDGMSQNNIGLGDWRTHMPFKDITMVEETPGKLWGAGEKGFFYVEFKNLETVKGSKYDGFSEINVSFMNYHDEKDIMVLTYENTTIDLLKGNEIFTITDIKRKTINGVKKINHIYFKEQFAYLSCSFGLVILDLDKKEIKESYLNIGDQGASINVNSTAIYGDSIYLATDDGILRAKNSNAINLSDFNNWYEFTSTPCKHIIEFNNQLIADQDSIAKVYKNSTWSNLHNNQKKNYVNMKICNDKLVVADKQLILVVDDKGTQTEINVNNINYAIIDHNDVPWFGINQYGLIQKLSDPPVEYSYSPSGPNSYESFDLFAHNDEIWVSGGGIGPNNGPTYSNAKYSIYKNNQWLNLRPNDTIKDFYDFNFITKNPFNQHIFIGSFSKGLLEFNGTDLVNFYGENNSIFKPWNGPNSQTIVPEVAFDRFGNMWAANYGADSGLVVRKANGSWKKFSINTNYLVMRTMVDYNDRIWMSNFDNLSKHDDGIMVYDHNGTIDDASDDRYRTLKNSQGSGNLPSLGVNCLHQNNSGEIWVGTDEGLAVFYNPRNIFSSSEDAQRIIIEQDGEAGYLLGTEVIYTIKDDGSGRKWVGTNQGAWLISETGSEVIEHFTSENSPLLSNTVYAVAIHEITGEVFFGTSEGIVSYRGNSSKAKATGNKIKIFPNPVKPEFRGPIAISGLPENALVKITDINGFAVYETTANGATATWDGNTFDGTRAATGVYLVFALNEEGDKSLAGKIFFIH